MNNLIVAITYYYDDSYCGSGHDILSMRLFKNLDDAMRYFKAEFGNEIQLHSDGNFKWFRIKDEEKPNNEWSVHLYTNMKVMTKDDIKKCEMKSIR